MAGATGKAAVSAPAAGAAIAPENMRSPLASRGVMVNFIVKIVGMDKFGAENRWWESVELVVVWREA